MTPAKYTLYGPDFMIQAFVGTSDSGIVNRIPKIIVRNVFKYDIGQKNVIAPRSGISRVPPTRVAVKPYLGQILSFRRLWVLLIAEL